MSVTGSCHVRPPLRVPVDGTKTGGRCRRPPPTSGRYLFPEAPFAVTAKVAAGGTVSVFKNQGDVDVIFDLSGYYP